MPYLQELQDWLDQAYAKGLQQIHSFPGEDGVTSLDEAAKQILGILTERYPSEDVTNAID